MLDGIDCSPGRITFDDLHLDATRSLSEQQGRLKEDLLQVEYPDGYLLDLGWYGADSSSSAFRVLLVRDADWEHPEFDQRAADLPSLGRVMRAAVEQVRSRLRSSDDAER